MTIDKTKSQTKAAGQSGHPYKGGCPVRPVRNALRTSDRFPGHVRFVRSVRGRRIRGGSSMDVSIMMESPSDGAKRPTKRSRQEIVFTHKTVTIKYRQTTSCALVERPLIPMTHAEQDFASR